MTANVGDNVVAVGLSLGAGDGDVEGTSVGVAVVGVSVGDMVLSQQDKKDPSLLGQQSPARKPADTQRW